MSSAIQPRIALVAFSSLGDGLIYLMMAENLRRNGFSVTYFGNIGYQLRNWLPQFEIRPYPTIEEMDSALADYHLVIMSPPQFLRDCMDEAMTEAMRRKWLLICQKTPDNWRFDLGELKRTSLPPEIYTRLKPLLDAGGSMRRREYTTESVVDITLEYLRDAMGLQDLIRNVPLTPPPHLVFRRHSRRIIISPDSAWPEKKDWPPNAFLKLCQKLEKQGQQPKLVVAPANHEHWRNMPGNRYETPMFLDIGELAAYIYESAAVIANDSGNGHLASFLGLPVVTIYRKKNPNFHWRPDWAPATVVCPRLTLPGLHGEIWKPFVFVDDVLKAREALS
ncbi:ADP-heptose:LPS heptosyltransferase [Azonexus fungiphilus]|uniref:ADP-heptose:LPS heptosyltransferase n=1 Tax=Azonexus fungiphilus TaxID=146940 RepID=A0A495WEK7_9RHOO|nr:glycosyltransferase family 9 protein [Azonexus fungiphilus]RKT59624.1 ADP-heptose:LPS heptosyltransferase [Azonexus fungiphilus]